MSTVKLGDVVTYEAGEDLSSAQYLFVTLESDGQVDLADATTDEPIGVLQNVPDAAGKEATVVKGGQTKVVAGEALAVNAIVGTNASGQAVAVSSGVWPCGRVVTAAGASGDVAVIEFFYSSEEIGGSDTFSAIACTGDITSTDTAADADCNDLIFQKSRGAIVQDNDDLGKIDFQGNNGTTYDSAAQIVAEVNGTPGATTDMPGRLVILCTPDGSATPGEVVRFADGLVTFADSVDLVFNTTTGTKIGTATGQKIGFWNATPVVQPSHNADPAACASMTHTVGTGADATTPSGAEYNLARDDLDALKTAVDANNAAIDAINADMATLGLTAAS
ncbi:MAG: DUF2190 family protein [Phycisphaerae bacterium]|nr:DUF2190 family protein [Phycisphaerae bacterium]NIP56328.1 DUF2190 family protein [Phycisphaerae bacterium]NIS54286.1 DUF2190 family protein [Phycisphaerae bacterium]NIX29851.1 DUF2190 family protein [Phycisphaerae bacterium]